MMERLFGEDGQPGRLNDDDELLEDAIRLVVENVRLPFLCSASVSHWLQQ